MRLISKLYEIDSDMACFFYFFFIIFFYGRQSKQKKEGQQTGKPVGT